MDTAVLLVSDHAPPQRAGRNAPDGGAFGLAGLVAWMACTAVGPWQHQATAGGRAGKGSTAAYIPCTYAEVLVRCTLKPAGYTNKSYTKSVFLFFFQKCQHRLGPFFVRMEVSITLLLAPRCAVYHVRRFRRVTFTNICATGKHGRPPVSCESAIRKDKEKKGGPPHPRPSLARAGSVWRICKEGRRFSANQRAPSTQPTSSFLSFCPVRLAWSKCRSSRPAACYKDSRAVG